MSKRKTSTVEYHQSSSIRDLYGGVDHDFVTQTTHVPAVGEYVQLPYYDSDGSHFMARNIVERVVWSADGEIAEVYVTRKDTDD